MPVKPIEKSTSSFFVKHATIADSLEQIVSELGGAIEGKYSSYFIEYDLFTPLENDQLKIKAQKQLTSVDAKIIPRDAFYVKITELILELDKASKESVVIKTGKGLKGILLKNLNGFNQIHGHPKHLYKTSSETIFNQILINANADFWNYPLNEFRCAAGKNEVYLKFFHFIEDGDELKRLITFFSKIAKTLISYYPDNNLND
ncbi:MAG: hypothetical protein KDD63_15160 [Bacteroidetes bacterium]|nr:hypothetical protein [Bacteroidota bacterium]